MASSEPDNGYIYQVMWWIENRNDTSFDFTQPYIRKSLKYVYPIFMFLYAVVGLVGLVGNIAMVIVMGKRRLYQDPTFFFLGNIAFSDLIKCVFVLPISLANMLVQNWIFGSFLCFFLPMIQFFPIHASMLTFLFIAIDRYRVIVNPFKARAPAGLCIIGAWVGAICVVLPHAVYIKYIDLGALFGKNFRGVGICYVNMERHIEEYFRAMFVTLYALPLAIIGFLYVKISAELKSKETASTVVHYSISNGNISNRASRSEESTPKVTWAHDSEQRHIETARQKEYADRATQDSDDDLDLAKEKITQNYLISMVTIFAMCWCPMNILILVHYFVHEAAEDVSGHFDITFITFAWFGYLSTCVNPILFASWYMPSSTKDRLKGYFRFSNRRRSSSQISRTEVSESFVLPATPSPREHRKSLRSATPSPRVHKKTVRVQLKAPELSPYHNAV
ncbi:prolactin-releasing peptide receptor-like [Ruditapes philippinarum]|uniref:prolactin-releasing peptide receptor-like n=1 Tax=Ruditapes philippinarum TaxID=129788 RepID=UPI00295AC279|nr:prolactin-releasing peptide receptor-like [Ruditapes philippinarum]XP_060578545.1 prolactin-releasing peptide receptor-like [Ruditapes philippinarum]